MDVLFAGGLDLESVKALVPPGSLEDCFNYEVGIQPGYQNSGGFERFDGRMSPSVRGIWDMTIPNEAITPKYTGKSLLVSGQNTQPKGLAFSTDGLKMYMLGFDATESVYQYHLATAWDMATAVYTGKSLDITSETTSPVGLAFNANLSKCYVASSSSTVYQYDLTTPGDVSTASYASKSVSVSSEDAVASDIFVGNSDTNLFMVGSATDAVYQYTMSTAGDISTATYDSKSVAAPSGETGPTGLAFAGNGTQMYVVGVTLAQINQYILSTAWDISTATADDNPFSFSSEETGPNAIAFNPDGSQFYVVGVVNQTVYQYYWTFAPNENLSWVRDTESGDLGVPISTSFSGTDAIIRFSYWNAVDALPDGATVTGDTSGISFINGVGGTAYDGNSLSVSAEDIAPGSIFVRAPDLWPPERAVHTLGTLLLNVLVEGQARP